MFKSILYLLASTAAIQASLTPHDSLSPREGCVINWRMAHLWVEDGMSRRRVDFSSEGTPTEEWCRWWNDSEHTRCGKFNVQCAYDENVETWHADASWFRGPAGDGEFDSCMEAAVKWWQDLTGCSTG